MAANPNVPQSAWDYAFARYMNAEFSPEVEHAMSENAVADLSDGNS